MRRRNTLLIMVLVALCAIFSITLCACKLHSHTFEKGYSGKDEKGHWHVATCEHSGQISGFAAHSFENGVCNVCGYELSEKTQKNVFVTLNYNGATGGNTQTTITVSVGKAIGELPTPTKDGYEFVGWKLDETIVKADSIWVLEDATATLNAQWKAIEYTVTFVADGKTVDTKTYTLENKDISIPSVPNKLGHTGMWEEYTLTSGNVTVNAVYTAKQYSLALDYDGATGGNTQQTITVTFNQQIGELPTPTKDGYEFVGWFFNDDKLENTTIWVTADNATIVAQWESDYPATEGLAYVLNDDEQSYSVTGMGTATATNIVIPAIYNDKPVTSIGDRAFAWCDELTSIAIPESITSIGTSAFDNCYRLVEVFNRSNLNIVAGSQDYGYIGLYAKNVYTTEGGSKLTTDENGFVIYEGNTLVSYIGEETDIIIPNSITIINEFAFYECGGLTSISIGNGVIEIGRYAFAYCSILTSVTIPDSVTYIGGEAFRSCNRLHYNEYDNAVYLGNDNNPYVVLVKAKNSSITSCAINDNTKIIYSSAFRNCNNLHYNQYDNALYLGNNNNPYLVVVKAIDKNITSCEINSDTKIIFDAAFSGCSEMTNVTMSDSVTNIGEFAFNGCSTLTTVYYKGSAEDMAKITIGSSNSEFENAEKVFLQ